MRDAPYWRTLGLAPTTDEAEIRKAYAARLKVTNPEDDAEGFKKLRAAYEAALWHARDVVKYGDDGDDDAPYAESDEYDPQEDEEDYGLVADLIQDAPHDRIVTPYGDAPTRAPDSVLDDHDARCKRLFAALNGDSASPWDAPTALDAVLTSPAMERLDTQVKTENWLVNLFWSTRPRAEALVDRVIAFYRWDAAPQQVHDHSARAQFLNLREQIAADSVSKGVLARVSRKKHEFYNAYKETTRPVEGRSWLSRAWSIRRTGEVERFLNYIEDKAPATLNDLNWDAVFWWRQRIQRWSRTLNLAGAIGSVLIFIAMIWILATIWGAGDNNPATAPSEAGRLRSECARTVDSVYAGIEQNLAERLRERCGRAIAAMPDSVSLKVVAATLELRLGAPHAALAMYESILAISPLNPRAMFGYGLAIYWSDLDRQAEGRAWMQSALSLDAQSDAYFRLYRLNVPSGLSSDSTPPAFVHAPVPPADAPPIRIDGVDPAQVMSAYDDLGIGEHFDSGRVQLECLVRLDTTISNCRVMEESTPNSGRADVVLRLANSLHYRPATLNGAPVDAMPVIITFPFSVEDSTRDGVSPTLPGEAGESRLR